MNTFYFWLWFVIGIASIVLEAATLTALVSIWFALGAIVALIAYFLGFSFTVQIFVFFAVSIALVLLIRPLASRYIRGNTVATNADRLISMRTRLIAPVQENQAGQVKANGLIWNAVSVDGKAIENHAMVEIVALEGSKLLVRKVSSPSS